MSWTRLFEGEYEEQVGRDEALDNLRYRVTRLEEDNERLRGALQVLVRTLVAHGALPPDVPGAEAPPRRRATTGEAKFACAGCGELVFASELEDRRCEACRSNDPNREAGYR